MSHLVFFCMICFPFHVIFFVYTFSEYNPWFFLLKLMLYFVLLNATPKAVQAVKQRSLNLLDDQLMQLKTFTDVKANHFYLFLFFNSWFLIANPNL